MTTCYFPQRPATLWSSPDKIARLQPLGRSRAKSSRPFRFRLLNTLGSFGLGSTLEPTANYFFCVIWRYGSRNCGSMGSKLRDVGAVAFRVLLGRRFIVDGHFMPLMEDLTRCSRDSKDNEMRLTRLQALPISTPTVHCIGSGHPF